MPDNPHHLVASVLGIAAKCHFKYNAGSDTSVLFNSRFARDIVTGLDKCIHTEVKSFLDDQNISLVSEESGCPRSPRPEYILLDPLDGSHNFYSGIKCYGTLVSYIRDSLPIASGISSLSSGISIFTSLSPNGTVVKFSRSIQSFASRASRNMLLAYGPSLSTAATENIQNLFNYPSNVFTGFHRTGSLAHSSSLLLCGSYESLFCQNVRIWDVLPILHISLLTGRYSLFVDQTSEDSVSCLIAERGSAHIQFFQSTSLSCLYQPVHSVLDLTLLERTLT
jgi:fructose-1,6-bisphosphatase/inositol monophosphatase family enzyme